MHFRASHKFARIAPRKVRLVLDQIRGKGIDDALETLQFSRKRGAEMAGKVVKSALANAEHEIAEKGIDLDVSELRVVDARADEGPKLKRWMPRARGMATPVWKRMSHIHVVLARREEE